MKTYILLISKWFLAGHSRAGQETNFIPKIIEQTKIHTVRENYDFWAKRVNSINNRQGLLSIRQWSERPYRSKMITYMNLPHAGLQRFDIVKGKMFVDKKALTIAESLALVRNDGFEFSTQGLKDFMEWLGADKKDLRNACIIHFTNIRYEPRKKRSRRGADGEGNIRD